MRRRDNTLVHEGARIADKFRLIGPLGDGGMGKVWLAKHLRLQRLVALKVLHRRIHENQDHRLRFEREAVAIGRLSHPGIVEALDFGELEDGRNFLAMEYVEGATLAALVDAEGPMDWRTVVRVGVEVADALAFAHARGVLHRDLKPDNLVVEGGDPKVGRVRILDLGLARIEGSARVSLVSERRMALGTVSYSAPEQLRGDETDARADVYGLGAVLYRLLTGQPPYPGECFADVVLRQSRGELAHPSTIHRDRTRPEALDRLILRCLEQGPDERPASAVELREALRALSSAPDAAASIGRQSWRRFAVGAALLAAGAVMGGAGAVLAGL